MLDKRSEKSAKSLRYTVWLYFTLFIIIILAVLWLFQTVFLEMGYQSMKTRDIKKVALTIIASINDPNYAQILNRTAYNNNMCINIVDAATSVSIYSVDVMAGSCEIHGEDSASNLYRFRRQIMESETDQIYLRRQNTKLHTPTLLFGLLLGSKENPVGFVFLNTSIDPLNSTIVILKEQMLYLTIAILAIGLVISFYMAKYIARPIVQITKSAEVLAEGKFNVTFDGNGYDEAERLAATLNFASEEISKVDSLRRDLIANISHDLRTPLTMVKAYAEMVRDLSGDNPVKRAEHVNVIIDESNRLAALVNDILDLSKIESNSAGDLNYTQFGIKAKLTEILERYKLLSEQQGYNFIYEADEEVEVRADVIKMEQVFYNLINNAVNYTGEDKTVIIRQKNSPDGVRVEISDTGAGIPSDKLALIFDRYYRTEKSQREVIGTGLGLSIVKAILKSHNYPFGVQSEVGQGSTFWIVIKK